MSKKIAIPIIVILLIALGAMTYFYFTGSHLSTEQRQEYLRLADEFDSKASEAQKLSDAAWMAAVNKTTIPVIAQEMAKSYQDLASEYRQQALQYRELVAK